MSKANAYPKNIKEMSHAILDYCGRTECSECKLDGYHLCTCYSYRDDETALQVEKNYRKLLDLGVLNTQDISVEITEHDPVNHPSHYTSGNIECIDAMVAAFGKEEVMSFCKLNAFKYIWRADLKNGKEDLHKAAWYVAKYLELKEDV